MWRSHSTNDAYGHCDIWHTPDTDQHSTDSSPPVLVQRTPCVFLLEKGCRTSYHRLFLCDRPYSPFAGYYDQEDVYVGCEYDIFGGEPFHSSTSSLSSSLASTTLEDPMDTFCNSPFSMSQEALPIDIPSSSPSSPSSSSLLPLTRYKRTQRDDMDQPGKKIENKRHKVDSPLDYLPTHHDDLVDYPSSWLFSSDHPHPQSAPVDSILEYI